MNYEQKYKEAIERCKSWMRGEHPECFTEAQKAGEFIFPELKESEDESIRKELLAVINDLVLPDEQQSRFVAWLEKQKPLNNFDEAEKEKNDFVSGQFIECRKSFNEFEEDNSYWLEYIGDDTYIGRSDNVLNQMFHITPRQLFTLFTHEHCPKENHDEQKESNWNNMIKTLIKLKSMFFHWHQIRH